MRINRPCVWLLSLVAIIGLSRSAKAQFVPDVFSNHDLAIQPFGDWDFKPDFQWFSPVINYEYGGEPLDANYGWFFTYDRQYLNVKRSNAATNPFDGDFTWGNRFDFGYMTEDDHGWMASVSYLRMGDVNLAQINNFTYTSIEVNKTWRLEPFYNDFYMEGFCGVRYFKFNDRLFGYTENNIIGGQLGARVFKQVKNFVLSGEFRIYPAHNYQFYQTADMEKANEEWVIGGETRVEVAYLITRDVAFRMGWDLIYFGQGIGRGNQPLIENDEDMLITGLTFGIQINR
jgi:hypothetical protein